MRNYLSLLLILLSGVVLGCKQEVSYDMSQPLPLDPNYRIGVLDNGMSYYIRNNNEPKDLANFYIIQKVGALLEEDSQDGLAHFLEHMAFNGTKHFPDKRIIKMLEEHGVAFGHDINAYTGLDRTVYNLSNIPVGNDLLLDSCLLVLHDWSNCLTLSEDEIDAERGVITEEWRARNGVSTRISLQTRPVMFEGSKYAIRDVIGDMEIVNNFEYQTLRDYYHKWYRPDLQAIAVVGAVDVDAMEEKIIELFSKIPAAVDPTPLPEFELQPRTDIGYVCATDKESIHSSVTIYSVNEKRAPEVITHGYLKEEYITSIYNSLLEQRISDKIREGSEVINSGSAGLKGYVKNYSSYTISASAKPNMEKEAIEVVYTEVERARRYGFNQSELDRIKASTLNSLENNYKQKDKISSSSYSSEIIDMFVDNGVAVDIEYYTPFIEYLVGDISIEDINEAAGQLVSKNNMVIVVTGPSQGVEHASKEDILDAMDRVEKSTLEPYYDEVAGLSLIDQELKGAKVKDLEKMDMFEAEKWTLANGAKVIFAKADKDKNSIQLNASSDGGNSLVDIENLLESTITSSVMGSFGMGELDPTLFRKFMSGKTAGISVNISKISESVKGTSSTKDFELMLQMVYLAFENPRFDQTQFDNIISRSATAMDMNKSNPAQIMQDSVSCIMSNYHPRNRLVSSDELRALTLEDIEKVYRERIQNAADFTFYVVGDIDKSVAKPLIEKYIGSISSSDKVESWVDHKIYMPEGVTERRIPIKFQTPKAVFVTHNEHPYEGDYSRKMAFEARILEDILTQRYTSSIREDEGGTYGVSVDISVTRRPRKLLTATVQFECDPDRIDQLKGLVFKEFELIKADGVSSQELSGVVKTIIKNLEQGSNTNEFVMQSILMKDKYDMDMSNLEKEFALLNSISSEDIQSFANNMFNDNTDKLTIIFDTDK